MGLLFIKLVSVEEENGKGWSCVGWILSSGVSSGAALEQILDVSFPPWALLLPRVINAINFIALSIPWVSWVVFVSAHPSGSGFGCGCRNSRAAPLLPCVSMGIKPRCSLRNTKYWKNIKGLEPELCRTFSGKWFLLKVSGFVTNISVFQHKFP